MLGAALAVQRQREGEGESGERNLQHFQKGEPIASER